MDADRFEAMVVAALDELPESLAERMDNVIVRIRDGRAGSSLLGLYEGVPLTEREGYGGWGQATMPDQITVYRLPICALCDDEESVIEQVKITVVHEVAHHFGIDDERLHELGWA